MHRWTDREGTGGRGDRKRGGTGASFVFLINSTQTPPPHTQRNSNHDLALNRQRALREEAELSDGKGKEFGKGAWIGDVQAVMKGQPTNLEITAVREGWVFALNAHNLGAYVHRYPGLFMLIYDRLFLL